MRTISLKLDDSIFEETQTILSTCKKPRNRYINEALSYYNRVQARQQLEQTLLRESQAVYASSLEVIKDVPWQPILQVAPVFCGYS